MLDASDVTPWPLEELKSFLIRSKCPPESLNFAAGVVLTDEQRVEYALFTSATIDSDIRATLRQPVIENCRLCAIDIDVAIQRRRELSSCYIFQPTLMISMANSGGVIRHSDSYILLSISRSASGSFYLSGQATFVSKLLAPAKKASNVQTADGDILFYCRFSKMSRVTLFNTFHRGRCCFAIEQMDHTAL
ncbi:hypothetical protein DFH29DRAFT_327434 [Suillus ampliporus]|nr:hypothetical protein DFH29DRAFT_327434 [Suillus ampliporus]